MMIRLILAVLLAVSPGLLMAQPKGVTRLTSVEGITQYQLDNGLKVLLFPDASKAKVTVNVTYMVGSRHENYGETGMAHLLEHLMYKGTDKYQKIMELLRARGANFNGTTWYDRTNYFETLAATDENLRWALDMEADRMVNSWIAKKDLDTEMTVVRNEYEAGETSPFRVLLQRTASMAYEWHNYGKATIGARSDIENVSIDRLQAFYRRYYQPDNAMLVVAGKFEEAKTLGWIAETFGRIAKPQRELPKLYTSEPTQDGERTVTVKRTGNEQMLLTAHRIPAGTHEDFAALHVLESILGDSPTGRLYKALVDNRKAAGVISMGFQLAEPGLLYLGARLSPAQNLEEARAALLGTIENSTKEPPSAEEVDRAKTKLLKQIELSLTNTENVGIDLSEWASMGDWRMLFLNRDRIRRVSAADVQRVARTYLKPDNRTVGQFVPVAKPDRAEIPATPDAAQLAALVKDYKGNAVMAQGEAFETTPENIDARTIRKQLPNGTKLVMLPKKNRGETVIAGITLRHGDVETLRGKRAASQLAWGMLMRGSARHSRQEIQTEFDKLKARVSMGGSPQFGTANIQTTGPNLEAVLKLAAEVLREPAFAESEFEPLRQSMVTNVEAQKAQPQSMAMMELSRHLNPYPAEDVRGVPTVDGMAAALKAVKLEDAKAFHRDFFGGSASAVITLVGDFDPARVESVLRATLGDWKAVNKVERVAGELKPAAAADRTIEMPDKPNAVFAAGQVLRVNDESPDFAAMQVANTLFGGGPTSRIVRRFREKEGWSYGAVSMLNTPSKDPAGLMIAMAIVAPQNMPKLEAAFREEVARVLKDGFTAEELEQAKKMIQQQTQVSRAEDMSLMNGLSTNEFWGRTYGFQGAHDKKIAALTLDEVNAAFRKHVAAGGFAVVKAGDFQKAAAP